MCPTQENTHFNISGQIHTSTANLYSVTRPLGRTVCGEMMRTEQGQMIRNPFSVQKTEVREKCSCDLPFFFFNVYKEYNDQVVFMVVSSFCPPFD